MKKTLLSAKGIAFLSLVIILFLGVSFIKTPKSTNAQKAEFMHTYLVKIPNCAGVCPYALMSMTHGRMRMVNNSKCTCPFGEHASYMTVKSKDEKSVIAMLPASIQKEVQIEIADNTRSSLSTRAF